MHRFFEFSVDATVKTVHDLTFELKQNPEQRNAFAISAEVAKFMRDLLVVTDSLPSFKNCKFAFANGEFLEIDAKGRAKTFFEPVPDWVISPGEFMRSEWLYTHELADLLSPEFVKTFMEMFEDVETRRHHANLLFDLRLTEPDAAARQQPASKPGNKHGKTTAPRVADLQSFELFRQFCRRLKTAADANRFPSLQILAESENVSALPSPLKQAYRTWFKAVTGMQIPNNKKVEAGRADLFCAPVRERLKQIEAIGLEPWYHALSEAIRQHEGMTIARFDFTFPHGKQ